jgi:glyoxalase family protein
VTLDSLDPERTDEMLELLGFERVDEAGERAAVVDVLDRPDAPRGREGVGTVHHVAFRAPDEETGLSWREALIEADQNVTPQRDRRYFQSIDTREPGGILLEVATDGPGFTRDESVESLGTGLKLPPWLAEDRETIEGQLPEVGADTGPEAD